MSLRTPLGFVRGLGSARSGTHHWWMQRVTALALIPLALWFVAAVVRLAGADYATAVAWFRSPFNASLLIATLLAVFYHAQLGMQVVFEDYIHTEWRKVSAQIALKFVCLLLGFICAIAALRISLGA